MIFGWLYEIVGGAYFISGAFALFSGHVVGALLCVAGLIIGIIAGGKECEAQAASRRPDD